MLEALGAFRQVFLAIFANINDSPVNKDSYPPEIRNFDWQLFMKSYDNAKEIMRTILYSEVLEQTSTFN